MSVARSRTGQQSTSVAAAHQARHEYAGAVGRILAREILSRADVEDRDDLTVLVGELLARA